MTLATHVCARLNALGVISEVRDDGIFASLDGEEVRIRLDADWQDAFTSFQRVRSSFYDTQDWSHSLNSSVEFPLVRLDPDLYRETEDPPFEDAKGNKVSIGRASMAYSLAHFSSADYEKYFQVMVRPRLTRSPAKYGKSLALLFRRPITATYSMRGRKIPSNLKSRAIECIKTCLFKLSVERHSSYEVSKPKEVRPIYKLDMQAESDWKIPQVSYDQNIVSYYKVARSSPFASQSYLAYYHVLEYYFLRVSEDNLHHHLRSLLHRPDFKSTSDGLDRLISVVRKQAAQDDETEMLRRVLQKFVPEEDFISFVSNLETEFGEKLYSKRRVIFGEALEISLKEGHAISNAAKMMKHVRNALVHSSDKYKREECHIPLTDSENTIAEIIPIVKYFAEQVIYGTASASEF